MPSPEKARGEERLTPALRLRVRTVEPLNKSRAGATEACRAWGLFGGSLAGGLQEPGRVLGCAVQPHFEMQVRTGGAPSRAHRGNSLAPDYQVTLFDEQHRAVRVTSQQPVTMVDLDHLTILRMNVREDDLAARGSDDRGAGLGGKIQTFVKTLLAREWIDAPAVARRKPTAVHRSQRRQEFLVDRAVDEQRLEYPELIGSLFNLARQRSEQRAELVDRQVARQRRRRAAAAGRLSRFRRRRQVLRLQPRHLGEPLAQTVELQQLCLQLSKLDRHRVKMPLNNLLSATRFLSLVIEKDRLQQRMVDRGRVAQRDIVEKQSEGQEQHQQAEAPEGPVPPVQRERSGPRHSAGHDDDIQVTFLRSCPKSDPHAPAGTYTFC